MTTTETQKQTDANGVVTATATATVTRNVNISPARVIPTLVYNCEYMPFICRNIANYVAANPSFQFDSNGLMKVREVAFRVSIVDHADAQIPNQKASLGR